MGIPFSCTPLIHTALTLVAATMCTVHVIGIIIRFVGQCCCQLYHSLLSTYEYKYAQLLSLVRCDTRRYTIFTCAQSSWQLATPCMHVTKKIRKITKTKTNIAQKIRCWRQSVDSDGVTDGEMGMRLTERSRQLVPETEWSIPTGKMDYS